MNHTPDLKWYTVTIHRDVAGSTQLTQRVLGAENLDQLLSGIKRHLETTSVDSLKITKRHNAPRLGKEWLNVLTNLLETDPEHYVVLVTNHNDFDSKLCSCGSWWPCGA